MGKIKVKTSREEFIVWSEKFMRELNSNEEEEQIIKVVFTKTGVNPWAEETEECLKSWLSSLEENAMYRSMLDAAAAVNIDQ